MTNNQMTSADWKDVLADYVLNHYEEELFNMSLAEIQQRCEHLGLDYTPLFKD